MNNKIIRAVTVPQSFCFCRDVMIKMREKGYEMLAVSSPGVELDELHDKDGFTTIAVPMARHISLLSDVKSLFKMIWVFIRERPLMVHSITPKAGLICMIAAWLTRVPVRVHTFTGLVWPTSAGIKRRILMATDWLTCACATHIIPEGQGVLDDLKNGSITKKPMKVLGYGNVMGVDMERFDPDRLRGMPKDENTFTFVFVGRIVGDKGINELVESFVKLNGKYPYTRLTLVGKFEDNLDPLRPETLKLMESCKAINACGEKYGDELLMEYLKSDCFVMPSYREGFPNTVMEAGALRLPSIVTDINGSREIIVDGKNGLIVPPCMVQPLYDAMERVITDNDLRKILKKNARQMIASRFEKSFVQGCLINYYEEILPSA